MLHIVLWKWAQPAFRERYTSEHVNKMAEMLAANLKDGLAYRIICVTDKPDDINPTVETFPIWDDHSERPNASGRHLPSCYRRLKLFDPATQSALKISPGDRICSFDLDAIITGDMTPIFHNIDVSGCRFAGWRVKGTYHPHVYNGSFWTFRAGDLTELWTAFEYGVSNVKALRAGYFGSDQAWLSFNLAGKPGSYGVAYPDFASYPREVRKLGVFDRKTRVVWFHGSKKPWHRDVQQKTPWISRYWRKV